MGNEDLVLKSLIVSDWWNRLSCRKSFSLLYLYV